MLKKMDKEIHKLNEIRRIKQEKQAQLNKEITELNMKLKELHLMKTQYMKLESGVADLLKRA